MDVAKVLTNKKNLVMLGGVALCILVVTLGICLLTGCGKKDQPTTATTTESQETPTENTEETEVTESSEVADEEEFVIPEDYVAIITVSINPKFNIYVGAEDTVLAVHALNADAVAIVEQVWEEGLKVEACMKAIVDNAVELGYLGEDGDMHISIETEDEEVKVALEASVEKVVKEVMEERDVTIAYEIEKTQDVASESTQKKPNNAGNQKKPGKNTNNAGTNNTATNNATTNNTTTNNTVTNGGSSNNGQSGNANNQGNNGNSEVPGGNAGGEPVTPVVPENPGQEGEKEPEKPGQDVEVSEYKLVWQDEFEGDALNMNDWNYEYHEPGWVNAEWQEYVDNQENIYVKDGNLVIQAIKTVDENGNVSYTSGRVNTQNKHDFKYGKFEARIKVPSGKGFLPAFWMMPTDESYYGQWPKCGEIDIMEVMGQSTDTLHGTIHFGEPHTQKQGTYKLAESDFASDFHVFTCEWEPGEIRWYVDGELYHTANDWFSKKEGFDEVSYPAPFDQPFYMILNLAVGGSWVGYPDDTTLFEENARLTVDYVKVYQKDSYDENVEKPEQAEIVFKDPDATGNYVVNGDFAVAEDLGDNTDWGFLLAGSGAATASISEHALHIETSNAGDLDYSVQVVQPNMSMIQGKKYRLSYDAYADAERTMIADITAPDFNYVRYLEDTKVTLTTEKQHFVHEFDMTVRNDANGRVEFNLGNQNSTATVHISNVRLEIIGDCVISSEKTILPDGNYVYNGEFQHGSNRMAYWDVPETNIAGTEVSVTNINGVRELKVAVPAGAVALNQAIVEQKDIAIKGSTRYVLSFDAYGDGQKLVQAAIAGNTFDCNLTTEKQNYTYSFTTAAEVNGATLQFLLGVPGVTYIDNVRIQEDGMLVNGNFSNGLTGFETFSDASATAKFSVDELNEGGAACIEISDTGDMDWKIQLKQNNVTLEEGKWYKIAFKAKSVTALGSGGAAYPRDIMCALQRNGAVHKDAAGNEDWTPYFQKVMGLTGEYTTFEYEFQMMPGTEPKTDDGTILTFSMGAVGGVRITDKHIVVLDDIVLEEIEAPAQSDIPSGTELITNGNFVNGAEGWKVDSIAPAVATADLSGGKAVFDITNPGSADWNVKLYQRDLTLENGASYEVKFNICSSAARTVKWGLMTTTYDWYDGQDLQLAAGEVMQVNYTVNVQKPTSNVIDFYISMGMIEGVETPGSTIEISDVSIIKK